MTPPRLCGTRSVDGSGPPPPASHRSVVHGLEVGLHRAALGARPVRGKVLERRPRRDAGRRIALGGVVDMAQQCNGSASSWASYPGLYPFFLRSDNGSHRLDKPRYIDVLCDSTGETAEKVVRAAMLQFPHAGAQIRLHTRVRTKEAARPILERAAREGALVVFTVVSPELREYIHGVSDELRVEALDLIGSLIGKLGDVPRSPADQHAERDAAALATSTSAASRRSSSR